MYCNKQKGSLQLKSRLNLSSDGGSTVYVQLI